MNEKLLQDNKNLVEFWDGAFTIPEEEKQAIRESGLSSPDEMAPSEKLLKAAAGLGAKKKVLDLGCGNGWAAAAAAKNGCGDVTAADPARTQRKRPGSSRSSAASGTASTPYAVETIG